MYATIRSAIMKAIQDNSNLIKAVYRTERSSMNEYPAAIVTPSENEADYHETGGDSNRETYLFTVRVSYPFTEGQDTADIALEGAVDELITIFRTRSILGAACDWVKPVPSKWGYQDRGSGLHRVADITIRAVVNTN